MPKRRGGKRMTAGSEARLKLNIKIDAKPERIVLHHEWNTAGLDPRFDEALEHLQTEVIELQERAIADGLINLGWCPPADHPLHREGMERLGYRTRPTIAPPTMGWDPLQGRTTATMVMNETGMIPRDEFDRAVNIITENAVHTVNPPIILDGGTDEGV